MTQITLRMTWTKSRTALLAACLMLLHAPTLAAPALQPAARSFSSTMSTCGATCKSSCTTGSPVNVSTCLTACAARCVQLINCLVRCSATCPAKSNPTSCMTTCSNSCITRYLPSLTASPTPSTSPTPTPSPSITPSPKPYGIPANLVVCEQGYAAACESATPDAGAQYICKSALRPLCDYSGMDIMVMCTSEVYVNADFDFNKALETYMNCNDWLVSSDAMCTPASTTTTADDPKYGVCTSMKSGSALRSVCDATFEAACKNDASALKKVCSIGCDRSCESNASCLSTCNAGCA